MRRIVSLAVLFSAVFAAHGQHALSYPHLVVFGDNYSDTLNTYQATFTTSTGYDSNGDPIYLIDAYPSSTYGYEDGQFTNGYGLAYGENTVYSGVWHQQLHGLLPGVPLAAPPLNAGVSTAGSLNYAWGSATTGSGTATVTFAGHLTVQVHEMNRQIDDYLNAGNTPDGKSLYVLFGGLNDLLNDSSTASATVAAANVTAEAKRLIDAGAVNVMVANVPGISANASSPIDVAAGVFATQLAMDIAGLQAAYAVQGTTVNLRVFDMYTLYANIFAGPANFGFTDVTDRANAEGANGFYPANVDQYLNWDGVNPTTSGHHQIAIAACTALAGTVTSVTTSAALGTVNQPATLTATVSTSGTYGPKSATTPTGSVTFYYPQTVLTTTTMIPLGTVALGSTGQASLTTAGLSVGSYQIYAVYSGDTNFATGCNSNVVKQTVAAAANSFNFSFSPTAAYIGMEEGVALNITTTPIGTFSGPVTFSCGVLPQFFACNFFNNQTVQVGSSAGSITQLNITSGTPTKAAALDVPPLGDWRGVAFAALLSAPLLAFGTRRRRIAPLLVALCASMMAGLGCGGSPASSSSSSGNSDPGYGVTHGPGITYAAPGTYTIPITATSGSLSVTYPYYVYIADTFDVGVTP